MDSTHEDLVAQFSAVTGANPSLAQSALAQTNWNLEEAVSLYYAQNEESQNEPFDNDEPEDPISQAPPSAAGGASYPPQTSTPAFGRNAPPRPGQPVTLRDLQRGADDDDAEENRPQDLFAGGEKSGLAVQNPGEGGPVDHFRNIMNQARQNRERPPRGDEEDDGPSQSSNFAGRAQTLGGDDAPSRVIGDAAGSAARTRQHLPRVNRTLHLWADGVSIDDGPLLRFDDPANSTIMQEINHGRAPKALLDVQPDQEVDLNLEPHKGENYVAPKKKYQPFGGQGQRLGSPTPGLATASSSAGTSNATAAPTATSASTQTVTVDESQPVLQLQIRLADGTRLVSRFNTTHTIGDVYDFVHRSSPISRGRPWALMTTFPSKELSDKSVGLGEISEFKRGGVIVQKWST